MNSVSNSDVICGKGPQSVKHPGNIRYCNYVKDQLDDFCNASKAGKHKIMQKVYKEVNKNGSFLKMNSDTNEWEKLDHQKALHKIALCFRSLKHNEKKTNKAFQAASTMLEISQSVDHQSVDDPVQDSDGDLDDDLVAKLLLSDETVTSTTDDSDGFLNYQRPLFLDDKHIKGQSWDELQKRFLPKKYIFRIIEIYAFHAYHIQKLKFVSKKSNAHQRVYRCAGCPSPHSTWQVVDSKINRNDNDSLWQVTDYLTI